MSTVSAHPEEDHYVTRNSWLRAAVMGANDGIVSVASLILGVAAANAGQESVIIAGVAGLAAGAMSMAAGEYVSVSSQSDTERADIAREELELEQNPAGEMAELSAIYQERGLSRETADQVAKELSAHDALGAHVRDELGLTDTNEANPLQAAFASAITFSVAASIPLIAAYFAPVALIIPIVLVVTVLALAGLGALGAIAGAAPVMRATARVVIWGVLAMAVTAAIGWVFGVSVA